MRGDEVKEDSEFHTPVDWDSEPVCPVSPFSIFLEFLRIAFERIDMLERENSSSVSRNIA